MGKLHPWIWDCFHSKQSICYQNSLVMGTSSKTFSLISYLLFKLLYHFYLMIEEEKTKPMVEAFAVIDIDPSLIVQHSEQQKWLTGIQIITQPVRDKNNSQFINLAPGIYLLLTFCESNKNPIYEIDFLGKPATEWFQIKGSELLQNITGYTLCYRAEPNEHIEPIYDVQLLPIERKNRFGENKEVINIPHGYKILNSQLPLGYLIYKKVKGMVEKSFKPILTQKYCPFQNSKIDLSLLPLFCFPEGIKLATQIRGFTTCNFILTNENAERVYVACLIFKQSLDTTKRQKLGLLSKENVFSEKALCIISKFCYTDQFTELLHHLYRLSLSKSQIPFYKIIETFTHELIFPEKSEIGKIGIEFSYANNKIKFPTNDRFPIVSERALYSVFKFLTVDNIINVFEGILLEKKILFVSQSKTILGYSIQAFMSFVFPFKWEQVVIPILPYSLKQYLTAPVPLIAGISPSLVDSSIQNDSLIVFLDKNEVLNDEDLPPLPQKLLKQLKKRLQKMQAYNQEQVNQFLQNPENTYLFKMQEIQDPHFQPYKVRDIFFEFTLTLMRNYKKFLIGKTLELDESHLVTDLFKVQSFLSDMGSTKVGSFGYKFTERSIFTTFIERICNNSNDPEIRFFDSCIERKKAKKQMNFIEKIQNQEYRIIKNPEANPDAKGPFFYQTFPSLHQKPISQESVNLQIINKNPSQIQNQLDNLIQEQYFQNSSFFQNTQLQQNPSSFQYILHKMMCLLLNSNKKKLEEYLDSFKGPEEYKKAIYQYFIELYNQQNKQIEQMMQEWPKMISEVKTQTMTKVQYLKRSKQFATEVLDKDEIREIYLISDSSDYQLLIQGSLKILILTSGDLLQSQKPSDSMVIQIKSYKLKKFINSIISHQASFFIDYIQKQNQIDLRRSVFKKMAKRVWNVQNLLSFRDWIYYEKEFGTGTSSC